ncbi:hypothetical protein RUM43_004588 [Polyplax serrata]|uniref:Uncharacterized protein n=1 Tax=Polyplax serrata TaxID=468196 RepID=A0AAN8SDI1_POLSC
MPPHKQVFSLGLLDNRLTFRTITNDEQSNKDQTNKGNKRQRRCMASVLTLLWPQVFGPVDQGIIEESDFKQVPKTLLEYRLDMIRKKAKEEEETRLVIRDYMKVLSEAQDKFYGYPNHGGEPFIETEHT